MPTFEQSLKIGKEAERDVSEAFVARGWSVNKKEVYGMWDFVATKDSIVCCIEVKNEIDKAHTGNICVEARQGRDYRESGLYVTESHVFVHAFGDSCVAYRTKPFLFWLARQASAGRYTIKSFGMSDNMNAGYVIPKISILSLPFVCSTDIAMLPDAMVIKGQTRFQ